MEQAKETSEAVLTLGPGNIADWFWSSFAVSLAYVAGSMNDGVKQHASELVGTCWPAPA
jgi:hypothetical protein